MTRYRIWAAAVIVAGLLLGWFVWSTNAPGSRFSFKLGLDLAGGTELAYKADMSETASSERAGALSALQGVIERRVNLFGVAEPLVQTETASALSGTSEDRLIVDLPGVTDVKAAVDALGETPTLDFRLATTTTVGTTTQTVFAATGLTGRYLSKASLQFASGNGSSGLAGEPTVVLQFNGDGAKLFEKITSEHVGQILGIFLDGQPISTPVIREAIPGGAATISGSFTPEAARALVQNLNFGALPVPITLVGSNTVGPTLGAAAIAAGLIAGLVGFAIVTLFMTGWYRLPGFVSSVALAFYLSLMLAVIKVVPVTLTASGIAGLIISLGMAVDANVLIFERIKEELRGLNAGGAVGQEQGPRSAAHIGFARAWPAIRDGHLTMLISGVILFWLGTSIVQGFALVFTLGVLASLISAVSVSRVFLFALLPENRGRGWRFLLSSGFRKS